MSADATCPATAFAMIRTLVLYAVAEHQLGHATTIRVEAEGDVFSVGDDGRGHAIARSIAGAPYLQFIYQHLDYPYSPPEPAPIQLQGLAMSLLNALCSELEVTVRKRDATLQLRFRHGQLQRHEFADTADGMSGNTVAGRVDPALAGVGLDGDALERWLRGVKQAHRSLHLSLNGRAIASD